MSTKAEWKARAKAAEAQAERLAALIDDEIGFKDLEVKMRDGTWDLRAVLGEGSRPATRFLAALMWHAILGDDEADRGEEPENYRATRLEWDLIPAGTYRKLRAEMALIKPGGKSPHEIRVELEERVAELEAELAALRSEAP